MSESASDLHPTGEKLNPIPESSEQIDNIPQAIFVLGGGNRAIEEANGAIRYTTSPYKGKFFPEKTGGAKARPIAAVELAKRYPDSQIITLSHRPNYLSDSKDGSLSASPSFASVMAADIERHGVESSRITELPSPSSTLTEIMEVIQASSDNNWENVQVIVSDYQKARAEKLLELIMDDDRYKSMKLEVSKLFENQKEINQFKNVIANLEMAIAWIKESDTSITFISAETILEKRSPHYKKLIGVVRNQEGYDNVKKQEREVMRKIESGEFSFAHSSFKEYVLQHNDS